MVRMGSGRYEIPSTVCLAANGQVQVGENAEQLAEQYPAGVARDVKRRIGDPVSLNLNGHPFSPQALMARVLRWAMENATAQIGELPELIAVTCPANWGPYKHELLRQVIRMAETPAAIVCTEPEPAAIRHAGVDAQRNGALVAVYDLGGGTFDAAVLRPTGSGVFTIEGTEGIEHMGGEDLSEGVYSHVLHSLGREALDLAESEDPTILRSMTALRRRCLRAKEEVSSERSVEVEVDLQGRSTTVSVTRDEFETMIRPALAETLRAFERAVRNSGTTLDSITSVVLVGGSVRIPLVFETISNSLDCQVVMPREPGHSVALGAAMAADRYRIPSRPTAARTRASHLPDHRPRVPIAGSSRRPRREATLAVHELVRLHREERASSTSWQVVDGAKVSLGQALATVQVRGNGTGRSLTLRSPFEGVLHRHFLEPGAPLDLADLLAAFPDVTAYSYRSGRSMPDDQGLAVRIQSPTSPTAIAGRPVLFVNRLPRAVWWSARLCVFTDPEPQVVNVAYMRHNQWFGFAAQQVDVPVGQWRISITPTRATRRLRFCA
jgi:actin-like ATPase involved in cell morphogenesis